MTLFLTGVTPLVYKWIEMDENIMIHRLYTSGVFVGSTEIAPIVHNR